MTWQEYRTTMCDFVLALQQSDMIARASLRLLDDFPEKLPKRAQAAITAKAEKTVKDLSKFASRSPKGTRGIYNLSFDSKRVPAENPETHIDYASSAMWMFVVNALAGRSPRDLNFRKAVYSQQLSMVFAHFEAFTSDSLRAMVRVRPNILKKSKTISWDELLGLDNWDNLLTHLGDTYVFDYLIKKSQNQIIDSLRRDFGFEIDLDDAERETISEAELLRHTIIHNAGRVSAEHLSRTKVKGLKIGMQLPIDHSQTDRVARTLRKAASLIFINVAERFYGIQRDQIHSVPL